MQFEARRRGSRVPNLTPLIDVVFLLLVFFMLTSHFVREEALNVELPDAVSGTPLEDAKALEIVVDAQSRLRVGKRVVEPKELTEVIRDALAGGKVRTVRLRGDRRATLAVMVKVLDAARNAGAEGVDIVAEAP